ncbi:MAG: sporulation protein YunB [Oscillospiraceae bacterium]|jgi:sporulation protein YunB|nr:sporulation protein YunB [Oscillospiraceae bacterium]
MAKPGKKQTQSPAKSIKTYRKKRKLGWRIAVVLAIPLALFIWADVNLRPVILTMAEARARVMAVQAMNDAVFSVMRSGGTYSDLIEVVMDSEGHVSMLKANTARQNELATQAAMAVQTNLDNIASQGIGIPLGAALGSKLLAGSGPLVQVQVVPVGAVSTEFVSEFTSAGINQTRHRIFLQMNTTVQMVIPTGTQTAVVSAHVPVSESIIVGAVPQSFVDVGEDMGLLDTIDWDMGE